MNKRKCIVTNKIKDKSEMIRIVKLKDGTFLVNSNEGGRGAYVSKNPDLIDRIRKNRILHRTFRTEVKKEIYEELIELIKGEKWQIKEN